MSPFYTEGDIPFGFINSKFGIIHRRVACISEFFIEDPLSLARLYV
jgi:hypothetical protein